MKDAFLKALAALLSYPTPELAAALPEIARLAGAERRISRRHRAALDALVDELRRSDLIDAQEHYVALFDRGRATSLYLFEHVHGDSRDRGQAMVDLKAVYAQAGLTLAGNELPDYLPALLEFLSLRPIEVTREMLGDCAHLLRGIGEALAAGGSRYASVFAALLALIGEAGLAALPRRIEEKPIDEEWAEAPVIFGPEGAPGAGCAPGGKAASVVRFVKRRVAGDKGALA